MATVGGNMANGSPAADLATPLLALDAAVVVARSAQARRKVPLGRYLLRPRRETLLNESLLVEVVSPLRRAARAAGRSRSWAAPRCDISVVNAGRRASIGCAGPREMGADRAGRGGAHADPRGAPRR